jgi:hypothetical protein
MMVSSARKVAERSPFISAKQDSDYRHLLAPSAAPSVAPSRATSIRSFAVVDAQAQAQGLDADADAITPAPAGKARSLSEPNVQRRYRGYANEDEYIKAFTEFLMEKQYFETDHQLSGFYGKETMDDYLQKSGYKSRADRKREKAEKKRRPSAAAGATLEDVLEGEEDEARRVEDVDGTIREVNAEDGVQASRGLRRMSRIGRVFSRRGTVE